MKKTKQKTQNLSSISAEEKLKRARLCLHAAVHSAKVVYDLDRDDNITAGDVLEILLKKMKRFQEEDPPAFLEEMLFTQAHTLEVLFTHAARRISHVETIAQLQSWGKVALKAQDQCRKTVLALNELKNPKKTVFIKQTNQAVTQQINNPLSENSQNLKKFEKELLSEEVSNACLEHRGESPTGETHQKVAALEKVHRAKD